MSSQLPKQFIQVAKPTHKPNPWHESCVPNNVDCKTQEWSPLPENKVQHIKCDQSTHIMSVAVPQIPSTTPLTSISEINASFKSLFHWSEFTSFVWLLIMYQPFVDLLSKDVLVNVNVGSDGKFTKNLMQMVANVYHTNEPLKALKLILTMREHGECKYKHLNVESQIPINELIESWLACLNEEWCLMKNVVPMCQISPTTLRKDKINEYFHYLRNKRGVSCINELFASDVVNCHECMSCGSKWREFVLECVLSIPVYGKHARFTFKDANSPVINTEWEFVPPHKLVSMSMADLIKFIVLKHGRDVGDIACNRKPKIEIYNDYYVTVKDVTKYVVFGKYLSQKNNTIRWKTKKFNEVSENGYNYCNQFKYTLEFWEIPKTINTIKFDWYCKELHIQETNKKLPQKYIECVFDPNGTYKTKYDTQTVQQSELKTNAQIDNQYDNGDELISLHEHMIQVYKHGYLHKHYCDACDKTVNILTRPIIRKLAQNCIVHIDQQQYEYYKMTDVKNNDTINFPLPDNKIQSLRVKGYITQQSTNNYAAHWVRDKEEQNKTIWYTATNNKLIRESYDHQKLPPSLQITLLFLQLP